MLNENTKLTPEEQAKYASRASKNLSDWIASQPERDSAKHEYRGKTKNADGERTQPTEPGTYVVSSGKAFKNGDKFHGPFRNRVAALAFARSVGLDTTEFHTTVIRSPMQSTTKSGNKPHIKLRTT